jgi:hypothetical protein
MQRLFIVSECELLGLQEKANNGWGSRQYKGNFIFHNMSQLCASLLYRHKDVGSVEQLLNKVASKIQHEKFYIAFLNAAKLRWRSAMT